MSLERIGNRYASALYELSGEDIAKAKVYLDVLTGLASVFEDKNVKRVMLSPVVKDEMKAEILKEIISHVEVDKLLHVFLDTVAQSGRVSAIPAISRSLKRIVQEKENTVEATINTVFELDDAGLSDVRSRLEKLVGKTVLLSSSVDKSILGGFVVQIGNSIIDMSLKTKLNAMSQAAVK